MRVLLFALVVAVCATVVLGWSKEDYEIFDLVSELEASEGKGTNFYSWLEVESSATTSQITKAYRKKSLELHPDKNPGGKNLQERFARLGKINTILRSPQLRERYNFFYKNGVPKWRGTGYYYSRFRPTLTHTLFFLIFLTSLFHLLVMKLNYSKDKRRVDYFEKTARTIAKNGSGKREKYHIDDIWGSRKTATVNGNGNGKADDEKSVLVGRRVKVSMVEGNDFAGALDLVVIDEDVYIPHDDGTLEHLSGLANSPNYFSTWPFRLGLSLLRRAVAVLPPSTQSSLPASLRSISESEHHDDTVEGYEIQSSEAVKPAAISNGAKQGSKGGKASRSATNTPQDSDIDDEDDEDDSEDRPNGGSSTPKKKKKGLGKSGGMRRRKMAMKR